jgi:chromosome partitioning protein
MEKVINDEPIEPQEGILHHSEGVDLVPANMELSGMRNGSGKRSRLQEVIVRAGTER